VVSPIDQEMMAKHTTRFEPGLAAHVACEGILSGGGGIGESGKGRGWRLFFDPFYERFSRVRPFEKISNNGP
jgi:hypothetical protein